MGCRYTARVEWFDSVRGQHLLQYTADAFVEKRDLDKERWRIAPAPAPVKVKAKAKSEARAEGRSEGATGASSSDESVADGGIQDAGTCAPPVEPSEGAEPTQTEASKRESTVHGSHPGNITVIIDGKMAEWHWYLAREGRVPDCPVTCHVTYDMAGKPHSIVSPPF